MGSIIRRLSLPTEFILVTLFCFWWSIPGAVAGVVEFFMGVDQPVEINDGRALTMVALELCGLALTAGFGCVRGWSIFSFGLRPSWKRTGAGIILAVAVIWATSLLGLLANMFAAGTVKFGTVPGRLTIPVVLVVSVVNPVFEEIIETGYFVAAMQRQGRWIAMLASGVFRSFLHAYQGANALVIVLPLGLIFALVYWRWRNLWPLIVAHVVFDLCALIPLAR